MKYIDTYKSLEFQKVKIEDVSIGIRQIGKGDNLVFIHGFPTHGYTWLTLFVFTGPVSPQENVDMKECI